MINIFNPLSPFMKLNDNSQWVYLNLLETNALKEWLRKMDKLEYWRAILKYDRSASIPINPIADTIKLQRKAIENWTKEQGLGENSLNSLDKYLQSLSEFSLQIQLNKRVIGGKFIPIAEDTYHYISPYGDLYPDELLFLYRQIYGFTLIGGSLEMPKDANLPSLDMPKELDLETEKTEDKETNVEPN